MSKVLISFFGRIIHQVGLANLIAILLLWVSVISLILGLTSSAQQLDAWLLAGFGLAGICFGWFLGSRRSIQGWIAAIITLAVGILIDLLVIGRLGKLIGELVWAEIDWIRQALHVERISLDNLAALDHTAVLHAWRGIQLSTQSVLERLSTWVQSLAGGRTGYDPVASMMVWALVVWIIAIWSAWWIRHGDRYRERIMIGLSPSGIVLAAFLAYIGRAIYPIVIWLGALLLLQALDGYIKKYHSWIEQRIDKTELEMEWALAVVIISVCLITIAVTTPSLSITKLAGSIRQALSPARQESDTVVRALGLKNPIHESSGKLAHVQNTGLPNRHLLGSGPELSERVVMWVDLEGVKTIQNQPTASTLDMTPPRYYWRGLTYDRYTGRGWSTVPSSQESFLGGESIVNRLVLFSKVNYEYIQQNVRMAKGVPEGDSMLYVAGELITTSENYQVAWRGLGDIFGAVIVAGDYRAGSRLARVNAQQLRAAATSYPDEIRKTYLQLPESVPRRVWDLAFDLTNTQPTQFDRALAIEAFLRAIPYSLDVNMPPANRDVVDYFLFDLKKGYCDYYATAFVVLARAAGLPARLVLGYASGIFQPENSRFVVTEADSHAWAEVYFPEYGWVEFEPTSARPIIERTETQLADPIAKETEEKDGFTIIKPLQGSGVLGWSIAIVSIFILLTVIWLGAERLRYAWMTPERLILTVYRWLYQYGRWFERNVRESLTPYEFADLMGHQLQVAFPNMAESKLMIGLQTNITLLADKYSKVIYSSHLPDLEEKRVTWAIWRSVQRRLWHFRLRRLMHMIYSKFTGYAIY